MEELLALADAADAAEAISEPSPKRVRTQPPRVPESLVNAAESLALLLTDGEASKETRRAKKAGRSGPSGRSGRSGRSGWLRSDGGRDGGRSGRSGWPQRAPPELSGTMADVGRIVLVPRALWPNEPCAEQRGQGWLAVIREAKQRRCTVRFLNTVAADEHLSVDVLKLKYDGCRGKQSTASVNDPKPKAKSAKEPSAAEPAAAPPAEADAPKPARKSRTRPPQPLTGTSADVGRKVLIPHSVWPDETCKEEDGRGWVARVVKVHRKGVYELRFCKARAADVCLAIDVLEPMHKRRPKPADDPTRPELGAPAGRSKRKKPDKPREAVAPSALGLFMRAEIARLRQANPGMGIGQAQTIAGRNWATSEDNPETKRRGAAPHIFPEPRDAQGRLVL